MRHESDSKQIAIRMPAKLVAAVKDAAERRKPAALMRIFIEDAIKSRTHTPEAA